MSKKFVYIKVSQTSSYGRQRLLIQRHFTCVLTLCCFFLEVGKNPLMTANKVHYSPFSYQIFAMQMKIAIQVCCMWGHRLSAKTEQRYVCQSIFLSLSLFIDGSCDAKDTLCHCQKNKRWVHGVLSNLFEYIKYSV